MTSQSLILLAKLQQDLNCSQCFKEKMGAMATGTPITPLKLIKCNEKNAKCIA